MEKKKTMNMIISANLYNLLDMINIRDTRFQEQETYREQKSHRKYNRIHSLIKQLT